MRRDLKDSKWDWMIATRRHVNVPKVDWDYVGPVFSARFNQFCYRLEDVKSLMAETGSTWGDLILYACEPYDWPNLTFGQLSERQSDWVGIGRDAERSETLCNAIRQFNETLSSLPRGWRRIEFAVRCPHEKRVGSAVPTIEVKPDWDEADQDAWKAEEHKRDQS